MSSNGPKMTGQGGEGSKGFDASKAPKKAELKEQYKASQGGGHSDGAASKTSNTGQESR
jgi:hypothetical protein